MRTRVLILSALMLACLGAWADEADVPRTFVNGLVLVLDGSPSSGGVLEMTITPRDGEPIVAQLTLGKGMTTKEMTLKMSGVLAGQVKGAYTVQAKGTNQVHIRVPKKSKDTPPFTFSYTSNVFDIGIKVRRD